MIGSVQILFLAAALWTSACFAGTTPKPKLAFQWKTYSVKTVQGRVLAWEPWASSWTPVKLGQELPEWSLVQVDYPGSVTVVLRAQAGFRSLNADSAEITIRSPAIVRLQDDMLRKMEVSNYFIPRMPDILKSQEEQKKDSALFLSMREGWERFAAVLMPNGQKDLFKMLLGQTSEQDRPDTEVAVRSKRLRLYSPHNGAILVTEKLPAELKIAWENLPLPMVRYEVRIWLAEQPRGEPITDTRLDYFVAKFFKEGNYLVQVTTTDGRYQSPVNRVHIAYPLSERIAELADGDKPLKPALPLLQPPADFIYVAKVFPISVSFHWEKGNAPEDNNQAFELVLKTPSGRELFRRRTREVETQLRFAKPGDFRWHIEALAGGAEGNVVRTKSDERALRVISYDSLVPNPALTDANPFDALFVAKSGLFFLEQGL